MTGDKNLKNDDAVVLRPEDWVSNHADYLFNYACSRTSDEELAKDLVQETFLSALRGLKKFEGRSSERTWLTAILKNKIVDAYRKKPSGLLNIPTLSAGKEQLDFFDRQTGHWTEAHRPRAFGIEAHDKILNKELNRILQACMQKLPGLWLSVFTMKHIDDETTEDVCRELKVTVSNFWVIIHRAKLNLRACMQKNWIN